MFIQIDNTYAIASDQHSWSIKKIRVRKDKTSKEPIEIWEAIRWYATYEQAVRGLGQLMVRTSEAQTLTDALADVEKVMTTLSQLLPTGIPVHIGGAKDA